MRPKNTSVTDRILDATLPKTLIVLVENTSFCLNIPFDVRNYIILWFLKHPLVPLCILWVPLGILCVHLGDSLDPLRVRETSKTL